MQLKPYEVRALRLAAAGALDRSPRTGTWNRVPSAARKLHLVGLIADGPVNRRARIPAVPTEIGRDYLERYADVPESARNLQPAGRRPATTFPTNDRSKT